jgi:hypothetical protein
MTTYTLTARVLDASGQVRAVKQVPFSVLDPTQELEQAAADLEKAAADLEEAAAELLAAEKDERHHHHHWWVP